MILEEGGIFRVQKIIYRKMLTGLISLTEFAFEQCKYVYSLPEVTESRESIFEHGILASQT